VIKIDRSRSSVTQRDNEKLETHTAHNPRPLLVKMIGNLSTHQRGNQDIRLVHKKQDKMVATAVYTSIAAVVAGLLMIGYVQSRRIRRTENDERQHDVNAREPIVSDLHCALSRASARPVSPQGTVAHRRAMTGTCCFRGRRRSGRPAFARAWPVACRAAGGNAEGCPPRWWRGDRSADTRHK
jgi:hypothetical protein